MLTSAEQDHIVFEKAKAIKGCFAAVCGRKLTKKNFKKLVAETLKKGLKNYEGCDVSVAQAQELKIFFDDCKDYLAPIVAQDQKGVLRIAMLYDDAPLCNWTVPVEMFFDDAGRCEYFVALISNGFKNAIDTSFLHPEMRRMIEEGDEKAINFMYKALDRPNGESVLTNLVMIRAHFPDFYKHITEKLDVMTVETMEQHIKDRNKTFK